MHYHDKAKAAAQAYFSFFSRLFGQTPNFPSGEERLSALRAMENIILSAMQTHGEDEHSVIDNIVLDLWKKLSKLISSLQRVGVVLVCSYTTGI